LRDRS